MKDPPRKEIIYFLCKGKRVSSNHIDWSFITLPDNKLPAPEDGYIHLLGRQETLWYNKWFTRTFYVGELPVTTSEGYYEK